jgi:1,3-beta-glucan synthase
MSGYQQPPPPKHTTSSYSSGNSDPFNNPHQLNYDPNANYGTGPNPYATAPGGPNPGAGGAGVAPPGAAGQYAPYYDNQPEMENRYEGGGMGRETWASESGWSGNGELNPRYNRFADVDFLDGQYSASDYHGQQNFMPSRSSTPTFTESRDGHRGREPYVSPFSET